MRADSTAQAYMELVERKAPAYVALLTARTDEEFEEAFIALLEPAVTQLERNAKNFKDLDEVGLSAVLAAALMIPGLDVQQEAHSNGHVDLTVVADHCHPVRRKLGEAKLYDGPEYHVDGLVQLLQRYTTGREGIGLLIEYCRQPNIKAKIDKVRARMDKDLPAEQQGPTRDMAQKWWFRSTHRHSSGEDLDVSHVGCNLHCDSI